MRERERGGREREREKRRLCVVDVEPGPAGGRPIQRQAANGRACAHFSMDYVPEQWWHGTVSIAENRVNIRR